MRTYAVDFAGRLPVDGYGAGGFRVAGTVHHGPLALVPEGRVAWGGPPDFAALVERAADFDVLLVGTGAALAVPDGFATARGLIEAAGAGVELMATPSACRTYNVLLGEGRRVAAALIPV